MGLEHGEYPFDIKRVLQLSEGEEAYRRLRYLATGRRLPSPAAIMKVIHTNYTGDDTYLINVRYQVVVRNI